jgi:hypothetical protein
MKFLTTIIGILAILNFASCTDKATTLEGKWNLKSAMGIEVQSSKDFLILKKDHTAIESSKLGGESKRTWSTKGKNLCLKAIEDDGGAETCGAYHIEGNQLIWNCMGAEVIYEKN